MTVTLINGFVLISHFPNWNYPPSAKRIWDSEIAMGLPGGETRQALRAVARRQVTFTVTAQSIQERVRLEARLDAAKLSGLACAPLHGRRSVLAQAANGGGNGLTLASTAWTWQAGDYAALILNDTTFDVIEVAAVDVTGLILTLAGNLANSWAANALCWPVIFGTLTSDKAAAIDSEISQIKITIAELTSGRSAQIGVTPGAGVGVGAQRVGKTNQVN
jgi:hypothetical protein